MSMTAGSATELKVSELASAVADEARHRFGENLPVYWFGSWVDGSANKTSDLDIALDLAGTVSSVDFMSFTDWVEDLPTLYKFDVINMSDISERFRGEILSSGRKL